MSSCFIFLLMIFLGNTFDLKLVSTGEDGIEEMIEDLNANKILYAFIKGIKILFNHFVCKNFLKYQYYLFFIRNLHNPFSFQ